VASSLPIIRQVAWLSVLPQLLLMVGMIWISHLAGFDNPLLAGSLSYVALSFGLRRLIPGHHRAGMKLFKQERFSEAIPHFKQSYEFFLKNPWLDRWRAITLSSSSRISYRELALLNLALCQAQTGEHDGALATYRQTLAEFPDSKVAQMAIRMLDPGTAAEI
jgi:tetratricopeptide (TPR) repeat protein